LAYVGLSKSTSGFPSNGKARITISFVLSSIPLGNSMHTSSFELSPKSMSVPSACSEPVAEEDPEESDEEESVESDDDESDDDSS